jgi:hypothetical protein
MADYSQLMSLEKKQKSQSPLKPPQQPSTTQPTSQSIDQSTDQSTDRSTSKSINQHNISNSSRVMEKPRAFYITERLNQRLDEAVRYYQEKHNLKKVDRSIIVTAILDNGANWTEEALDLILTKIINQLTSRLINR